MTRYFFWPALANAEGASMLNKLWLYYLWSFFAALVVGGICIGIGVLAGATTARPVGPPLRWVLEMILVWVSHPVAIAECVASVVVAPEDPDGPQTAAWSHVFWLAELPWVAICLYASFRMFRSGLVVPAMLTLNLVAIYLAAGTIVCYSQVVV